MMFNNQMSNKVEPSKQPPLKSMERSPKDGGSSPRIVKRQIYLKSDKFDVLMTPEKKQTRWPISGNKRRDKKVYVHDAPRPSPNKRGIFEKAPEILRHSGTHSFISRSSDADMDVTVNAIARGKRSAGGVEAFHSAKQQVKKRTPVNSKAAARYEQDGPNLTLLKLLETKKSYQVEETFSKAHQALGQRIEQNRPRKLERFSKQSISFVGDHHLRKKKIRRGEEGVGKLIPRVGVVKKRLKLSAVHRKNSYEDCNVTGSGDEAQALDEIERKLIPDSLAFRRSPEKTFPIVDNSKLKNSRSAYLAGNSVNFEEMCFSEETSSSPTGEEQRTSRFQSMFVHLFLKPETGLTATLLSYLGLPETLAIQWLGRKRRAAFKKLIRRQVHRLALAGFSTLTRLQHWNWGLRLSRWRGKKWAYELARQQCVDAEYDWIIDRDIERTWGPSGGKLARILKAITVFFSKSVGYCQGMNFVAAAILANLGREDFAFWMIVRLFKSKNLAALYTPELKQVRVLCFTLEAGLRFFRPELWKNFESKGVQLEYCTSKWFLTMFAYDAELELGLTAIDLFILDGWKGLLKLGLALLVFYEEEFYSKQYDQAMVLLNSLLGRRGLDTQKICEISDNCFQEITNGLLQRLEFLAFDQDLDFQKAKTLFQEKRDSISLKSSKTETNQMMALKGKMKEIKAWRRSPRKFSPVPQKKEPIRRETIIRGVSAKPQLGRSGLRGGMRVETAAQGDDDCNIVDTPQSFEGKGKRRQTILPTTRNYLSPPQTVHKTPQSASPGKKKLRSLTANNLVEPRGMRREVDDTVIDVPKSGQRAGVFTKFWSSLFGKPQPVQSQIKERSMSWNLRAHPVAAQEEEVVEEEKPPKPVGFGSQRLPALAHHAAAASPPSGKGMFYKLSGPAVSEHTSLNLLSPLDTPIFRTPQARVVDGGEYKRVDPKDVRPEMEQFTIKNIDTGEILLPLDFKYQ